MYTGFRIKWEKGVPRISTKQYKTKQSLKQSVVSSPTIQEAFRAEYQEMMRIAGRPKIQPHHFSILLNAIFNLRRFQRKCEKANLI